MEGVGFECRAEQEALHLGVARGFDQFALGFGLNAFCGRHHSEAAAKACDRVDDGCGIRFA